MASRVGYPEGGWRLRFGTRSVDGVAIRRRRWPFWVLAGLALLVLGAGAPQPAAAQSVEEVPNNWPLKPSGLEPGDTFRLLFATSVGRDAESSKIADYNEFVQTAASTGHLAIREFSDGFRVVGSTETVDARDNTSTTGVGERIYWLGGNKVADNYADFYDGTWDDEANPKDEDGNNRSLTGEANWPFTGTNQDGTGAEFLELGTISLASKIGKPNVTGAGPLFGGTGVDSGLATSRSQPFYALSQVFRVATNIAATGKPSISGTARHNHELTAGVGTLSDANGLPDSFSYQWLRVDSDGTSNETEVGTDSSTYLLTADDVGKKLRVKVTYTDSHGYDEGPFTSDAFPATTNVAAAATDATLRALSLSGLSFAETFAANVTSYTASATYAMPRSTVAATPNEPNATVAYQDGEGVTLEDADADAAGFQVDFTEGENVIEAVVTAEDGTTTRKYTMTVTRSGPTVTINRVRVTEGSVAVFKVTLSGPSDQDFTFGYVVEPYTSDTATTDANAPGGADYTRASGTVTILAGDLEAEIRVPTNGDTVDEDDEIFSFRVPDRRSTRLPWLRDWERAVILDNDDPQTFDGAAPVTGSEGDGSITVTVNIAVSGKTVSMDYATANGTARAGSDYVSKSGTLEFEPGETSKDIEITLSDDEVSEGDETFDLVLSNPSNIVLPAAQRTYRVTVEDDEAIPQATLVLTPASVDESGGNSVVTATLDRVSSVPTTISISVSPVAPAVAGDVTLSTNKVLTIPAGATESTGTVTIGTVDNTTQTDDKKITVSGAATNTVGVEAPDDVVLTIEDDDLPASEVVLTLDKTSIAENATALAARTVRVTATLDYSRRVETIVTISVKGGTATAGTDFTGIDDFAITIPAFATSATRAFELAPVDDRIDEPNETVSVSGATDVSSLTMKPADGLEVTIADNDATPRATLMLTPAASIREDGGSAMVTAVLDRPSSEATTITVAATAVSPATSSDFTQTGTTLTIAAGRTSSTGSVTVTAVDNEETAADKTITVSGVAANDLGVTAPSSVNLTITDDESETEFTEDQIVLTASPAVISESVGSTGQVVTITATYTRATSTAEQFVPVGISGVTAVEGTDFTAVPIFIVRIPANQRSGTGTFTLRTIDNNTDEPNRTLRTTTLSQIAGTTLTIEDDDATPVPRLVLTPASIGENGGSTTVTAVLDRASSEATTITVSAAAAGTAAPSDFALSANRTITIPAGALTISRGTVTITATDNSVYETGKSVAVTGTASNDLGVNQPARQPLAITEDDVESTTVTLTVSPATVAEGATAAVTVTARLNADAWPSATPVTVSVEGGTAVEGTDFAIVNDFTLTIPAGATSGSQKFNLATVDDETNELAETVRIAGSASGLTVAPSAGLTVSITDNDPQPTVTMVPGSSAIGENGGTTTITARLDRPWYQDATIEVDVLAGGEAVPEDFELTGSDSPSRRSDDERRNGDASGGGQRRL